MNHLSTVVEIILGIWITLATVPVIIAVLWLSDDPGQKPPKSK